MYADRRFCQDAPLKTYLYLRFRQGTRRESDIP
jgi:hypothetical protein